jgi:amino acid transporter
MTLRSNALSYFDVTNMTVGAIVGADIYIAAAITAGMLGPASLLAWALAGLLATILALTLAECARLVRKWVGRLHTRRGRSASPPGSCRDGPCGSRS